LGNISLIPIASIIFPIALGDKNLDLSKVISSAFLTVACWVVSVILLKGKKK